MAGIIAAAGFGLYLLIVNSNQLSSSASVVPTAVARVTTLQDNVVEQGELESQSTITGACEIDDHENKIIFLAPEGERVEKGEVVAKFDPSEITKEITERETRVNEQLAEVETARQELKVQEDENKIAIRKAKQDLEFAELDLKKYMEGDYLVKKSEIQQSISEAATDVAKANRDMANMRALVKRGFREFEQLREAEQVVTSAGLKLKNAEQKMDTLERFEHVKSEAEFKGKAVEAKFGLSIAETTATAKLAKATDRLKNEERGLKIQNERLAELKKNLALHEMKAPQAGTLVYARDDWRGDGEKVHEGSLIYQNQPVFVLPDMKRMQVKVGIHETLVAKVKPNQKAVVRVDAFSSFSLKGTVKSVSTISASTRWERSNNYQVFVTIDSFPEDLKLRPGMSAEVEIKVGEYPDVLAVPIQAVTSNGRKKFVFVETGPDEFEPTEVVTGESNLSFVALDSGLNENDVVALDAYQRGLAIFKNDEGEQEMLQMEIEEQAKKDAEESKTENKDTTETSEESADDSDEESSIGMTSEETAEKEGEDKASEADTKTPETSETPTSEAPETSKTPAASEAPQQPQEDSKLEDPKLEDPKLEDPKQDAINQDGPVIDPPSESPPSLDPPEKPDSSQAIE